MSGVTALVKKGKLGTNIPSSPSSLVQRFNELNVAIRRDVPQIAKAYIVLHRHVPLLREMQALLSQRPKTKSPAGFDLERSISEWQDLPTWTQWLTAYSEAVDYSVRHLRRVINEEPPKKFVKECGWSTTDHNSLLRAATLAFDLVNAIDAGADTTRLIEEVREVFDSVDQDILDKPFEPKKKLLRKKPRMKVA